MVVLYLLGVILSERLGVDILGLTITPLRMLLLVSFIPMIVIMYRDESLRFQVFDWLIIFVSSWGVIALLVNNGLDRALKYGGALALEMLGGYFVARAFVRTRSQFSNAVKWYIGFVAVLGVFATMESLLGFRPFALLSPAAGNQFATAVEDLGSARLGLSRAAVSFDVPILYGVFCATSLGLGWYLYEGTRRWLISLVVIACTFFSLSSAPLLACVVTLAFIIWEKATRAVQYRTGVTMFLVVCPIITLQAFSNRSLVEVVLPYIVFDHWTAYYRLLIWEYASANIENQPWFGIGLNDWVRPSWMPPSVDNFWLVVALTAGLPALVALVALILTLLVAVNSRGKAEWRSRLGWTAAVLVICMQASTVHYWGSMHSFCYFILGLGAWITDNAQRAVKLDSRVRLPGWGRRSDHGLKLRA